MLILDEATAKAHVHAANALSRLSIANADNQMQVAKHCVALLANTNHGAQQRASDVLKDLADNEPGGALATAA